MSTAEIDRAFFTNYAGSGKPYKRVWRQYCYFDECCALFKDAGAPKLRSVCVLGTATGEIAAAFYKKFKIKIDGCEVNAWAHAQTPADFKSKIRCTDMEAYIKKMQARKKVFTLVFSNSLIYLPESHVLKFLKDLSHCTKYLHVKSSTSGSACPDPWRQTLRPYKWWCEQYLKAGFVPVPGANGQRTYLWQSLKTLKTKPRTLK